MIDADRLKRLWNDTTATFAEMETIRTQLDAIYSEMKLLDSLSADYRALDRIYNALQKDWDEAYRRFKAAHDLFSTHVRTMGNSNSRSAHLRAVLEAHFQHIEGWIDRLDRAKESVTGSSALTRKTEIG